MRRMPLIHQIGPAAVLVFAGAAAFAGSMPDPGHHRLDMRDLMFRPAELEVAPGDTVTWINRDIVPHTVTAANARWDSGEIPPGGTFTVVVKRDRTLDYICLYHPTMTGRLEGRR